MGCGEPDPTESDQYVAVQEDLDAAKTDREQLQTELDARESDVETLEAERDDLATERDRLEEDLATSQDSVEQAEQAAEDMETDREDMKDERDLATEERDAAVAEADRLREQYDPQIRVEIQLAVDGEIARACEVAKEDIDTSIRRLVKYDDSWAPVADRQKLVDAVAVCAAEERAKLLSSENRTVLLTVSPSQSTRSRRTQQRMRDSV